MTYPPTYQDWLESPDKQAFILSAINYYKASEEYKNAETGLAYYERRNTKILARLSFLERTFNQKLNITFHKLCNGLFQKMTKQVVFYSLANGLTMDADKKAKLGRKFDKNLLTGAIYSFWGGVAWFFPHLIRDGEYNVRVFSPLEVLGLPDEYDGSIKAAIRFTQISPDKPLVIEFFTLDGLIKYKVVEGKITETAPLTAYKLVIRRDILAEEVIAADNYPSLPLIPMYANMSHKSEFSAALKASSDAYDFINSDLADAITQVDGLYWAIKNYGGNDAQELVMEMQRWKATVSDGEADAQSHVVEAPYLGKLAALKELTEQMYSDFMALDMKSIQGGSLTNVAINVSKSDLDIKADELEWQVVDCVENIMGLMGIEYEEPKFTRRTITNDTETITNISTQLSDGYIDMEEAVYLAPNILESRKEGLLERLAVEAQQQADAMFPLEDGADGAQAAGITTQDVRGEVQETAGRSLNGAQTQALMSVLGQYTAGAITIGQAVNIVSVAIGISKEEAKNIIEGLE